jgi:hypothetical protein
MISSRSSSSMGPAMVTFLMPRIFSTAVIICFSVTRSSGSNSAIESRVVFTAYPSRDALNLASRNVSRRVSAYAK